MEKRNNLALVLHSKEDLRLEYTCMPKKLGPYECLLQTHSCGICDSDMHLLRHGQILHYVVKEPVVIGHEISAKVVDVGESVTKLKAGDRVAVEPLVACLRCDLCRAGKYNLCQTVDGIIGKPPYDGGQQNFFTHLADFCHKIPDNMTYEEAALIEPLSVVVHALRRFKLSVGDNVLICGAGTIGLLSLLCAKAFGANKVFITDINPNRVELAKKLGADFTYIVDQNNNISETDFAHEICADMEDAPDITIECSGSTSSVTLAMYVTKIGGKIGIIGVSDHLIKVPLIYAALREVNIIGSHLYKDDFPLAINLVSTGKINIKPLITHKFNVEHYKEAFNLMKSCSASSVKILIQHQF